MTGIFKISHDIKHLEQYEARCDNFDLGILLILVGSVHLLRGHVLREVGGEVVGLEG